MLPGNQPVDFAWESFKALALCAGAVAYCCGAVALGAIAALLGRFLPRLGRLLLKRPFF